MTYIQRGAIAVERDVFRFGDAEVGIVKGVYLKLI